MIVQIIYLISSPCHCLIWSLKTNLFQKCPKSLNKNILHRRWFLLQWYKWMSDYGQWRLQPQSSSSMLQYPWRPNLRSMPCWIPGKGVSDLKTYLDYFALLGRSCEIWKFIFPPKLMRGKIQIFTLSSWKSKIIHTNTLTYVINA